MEKKKKEASGKERRIKDMRHEEECVLTGEGTLNIKTDR